MKGNVFTKLVLSPNSNIPLMLNIYKLCNIHKAILINVVRNKFRLARCTWSTLFPLLVAVLVAAIHIVGTANWLRVYWWSPSKAPTENWKLVLVGYCGFLHAVALFALLHIERMIEEIVIVQNSCMETDLKLTEEDMCLINLHGMSQAN